MTAASEIVFRLTQTTLTSDERRRDLHHFAEETGWYPSDAMDEYPGTEQFANGHLLVEHGMANTAVITFLKPHRRFNNLEYPQRVRLLGLSYNNLVDWHLLPDADGLTAVYNRTDPAREFRLDGCDAWRAEKCGEFRDKRTRAELRNLDDALIATVSHWKRMIGGELGIRVDNSQFSALFNALIFVRAIEDLRRSPAAEEHLLLDLVSREPELSVWNCLCMALGELGKDAFPSILAAPEQRLRVFDRLARETVRNLLADFYKNRFCPYSYDFRLISKHALSRIYEHYVSVLRSPDDAQPQLFPGPAQEVTNRDLGAYYTPQYIARFFARYLKDNALPCALRTMKVADPACGSGIFLRTMLELRHDHWDPLTTRETIHTSFQGILGLDIEAGACEAARLSLSLLHLSLTQEFPKTLNIQAQDAVAYVQSQPSELATYDVVVTNPPYIPWDRLPEASRDRMVTYLGPLARGKVDAYLALVKVGLDLLRPGGFGMFVLPRTFLNAANAGPLRGLIADDCWIRLVADLSELRVFQDVSSYTALLIVQRKTEREPPPLATVVKCRAAVGDALATALKGHLADNDAFRVFECTQNAFGSGDWKLLPPLQEQFLQRLATLPQVSDLATVHQGVVTGADDVFIRRSEEVPPRERGVWRPLLSDREMLPYTVPRKTASWVFYPFDGLRKLGEEEVRRRCPATWKYLEEHQERLMGRKGVVRGEDTWWCPDRVRNPGELFRPKIVCPHLMLSPRFALDEAGISAVTRSVFLVPGMEVDDVGQDVLKYLVAVLNSTIGFWQAVAISPSYERQYAMVEARALKLVRVPDPRTVPPQTMQRLLQLVTRRMKDGYSAEVESSLDDLVAEIYEVAPSDLQSLGIR